MTLWLLRPKPEEERPGRDPWNLRWDCYYGFVVRAETEQEARNLADKRGDESARGNPWQDPAYTTCTPLSADGPAEVIMEDFLSG